MHLQIIAYFVWFYILDKTGVDSYLIVKKVPAEYAEFHYRCKAIFDNGDPKQNFVQYNYIKGTNYFLFEHNTLVAYKQIDYTLYINIEYSTEQHRANP